MIAEGEHPWRGVVVWLCPLWWVYIRACRAFVSHDCEENPIACRISEPVMNRLIWLDHWQST